MINNKNPFYVAKNLAKPQTLTFVCECKTLREARNLRAEIVFRAREMGYVNSKDFNCKIIEKEKE